MWMSLQVGNMQHVTPCIFYTPPPLEKKNKKKHLFVGNTAVYATEVIGQLLGRHISLMVVSYIRLFVKHTWFRANSCQKETIT